jgi:hypothetical protein
MSAASLVRIISKGHEDGLVPTILYDEIDNVFCKNEDGIGDLRAALNAGYRRGATATRCTNHGSTVTDYICYAPVAVAGLRKLPDTLASRSIFIHMQRAAPDEEKEQLRLRRQAEETVPIFDALSEWCVEISVMVTDYEPEMPAGITDRTADCWEPLLAIADAAGREWPGRAREAAVYLSGAAKDDSLTSGVELLAHIRDAFLEAEKIWTTTLLQRLCDREESPWADIRGKALGDRGLADRLRPYGIK